MRWSGSRMLHLCEAGGPVLQMGQRGPEAPPDCFADHASQTGSATSIEFGWNSQTRSDRKESDTMAATLLDEGETPIPARSPQNLYLAHVRLTPND